MSQEDEGIMVKKRSKVMLEFIKNPSQIIKNDVQELRYPSDIYSNAPWVRYLYVPRIVVALCAHAEQAAMVRLPS